MSYESLFTHRFKNNQKLDIKKGTIITPSAKSFLSEKKIDLHYIDEIAETKVVVEPVKKKLLEQNSKRFMVEH